MKHLSSKYLFLEFMSNTGSRKIGAILSIKKLYIIFIVAFILLGCGTNPLTGQRTMAFIPNSQLFAMSAEAHRDFINENTVVTGTPEAEMLSRVGWRLVEATQKWMAAQGRPNDIADFPWSFTLIQDNTINAWVMPGGKIVFYTGILPLTQNEDGIAVVMGHEIAHAVLNHGQQRMSASLLQQFGLAGLSIFMEGAGSSPELTAVTMTAFGVGSTLLGTLPFSRRNEDEADHLGLILMAIAGYNPYEAVSFWERMNALGGSSPPQWLSTHPSHPHRINNLRQSIPEAKRVAAEFGVHQPRSSH
ncbi:MAG: M48 family metallopeptidase [Spirochaetaceae bacterium]|nr:M48 family metallopeptidase [Spirochaetaceae bacterium]